MDDVICVAIIERVGHLVGVLCRNLLAELFFRPEFVENVTARCKLEDQVNLLVVVEVSEELKDVWVIQAGVDFNLPD